MLVPLAIDIGNRQTIYHVNVAKAECAWIALGIRKSGSSIFSSIVNALANFNDLNTIDIPGTMFKHGDRFIEWNSHPRLPELLWRGNVYIGFRDPPTGFYGDPVFREARKILMVRDPRDALVSEYFSNAYSHSVPTEAKGGSVVEREREKALQTDIEDYVLKRIHPLNRTVGGFRALVESRDPNLLVLRYEDVILDKANWIRTIVDHFGWEVTDQMIDLILSWADIRPEVEDKTAFVRRVAPGDHLDKLSPAVIAKVDSKLSDVWESFGYAISR